MILILESVKYFLTLHNLISSSYTSGSGTRLVRDPDGLVGRTGSGSRTWPSFFSGSRTWPSVLT